MCVSKHPIGIPRDHSGSVQAVQIYWSQILHAHPGAIGLVRYYNDIDIRILGHSKIYYQRSSECQGRTRYFQRQRY